MRPLFLATILIVGLAAPALAQTARQIAQRVFPSVVMLIIEDTNGQDHSQGSGFVVAEGVVATNFHVIEGGVWGVAKIVGSKRSHEITGVLGLDAKRDLVLLAVPSALFQIDSELEVILGSACWFKLVPYMVDISSCRIWSP